MVLSLHGVYLASACVCDWVGGSRDTLRIYIALLCCAVCARSAYSALLRDMALHALAGKGEVEGRTGTCWCSYM
jgi:hypothetical protein